ncbi:formate/nitrite transporter family protein [Mesomycoplasma moatsii]|uniref:formate/nitrite transporter family protein n=1 Tax=Mesomycoplasma moatsii TaxID=171287 RepID=UPI0003B44AF7
MKEYKENFKNAIRYATHKLENTALRMIVLGMLGSIYVGIAYMIFIIILGSWDGVIEKTTNDLGEITNFKIHIPGVALFTAAALFPVGIIMILFLGGSLFTSDNLTMLAWITKQKTSEGHGVQFKKIFIKWMYTLLGNILGGLVIGGLCRAANFFANENYQYVLGYLCGKKISMAWYFTIFSGFLCNILVAGSVWASLAASHSTAKLLLIYFPIWMFAISGFQHVVANGILFSMGLFYMIEPTEQNNFLIALNYQVNHNFHDLKETTIDNVKQLSSWINPGKFIFALFFINIIPAGIGNWISGSIFLPYTYYYLSGHYKNRNTNIHNL